jgi:hypothetical protein
VTVSIIWTERRCTPMVAENGRCNSPATADTVPGRLGDPGAAMVATAWPMIIKSPRWRVTWSPCCRVIEVVLARRWDRAGTTVIADNEFDHRGCRPGVHRCQVCGDRCARISIPRCGRRSERMIGATSAMATPDRAVPDAVAGRPRPG